MYGGVPIGNRTRVSALKGPRPDRWTMGTLGEPLSVPQRMERLRTT